MAKNETLRFNNVDLGQALDQVSRVGIARVPNFITQNSLLLLQEELGSLNYEAIEDNRKPVYKRLSILPRPILEKKPILAELGENIRSKLAKHEKRYPALSHWAPNDFTVQKYDKDSYLSSHRDADVYNGVVVVASIQGEAFFEASEERQSGVFAGWRLQEGDVVILRAAGFDEDPNKQMGPYHLVHGAITDVPRISIGIAEDSTLFSGFK